MDKTDDDLIDNSQTQSLNTGIAIVVGAQHILDVLNAPPFDENREALKRQLLAKQQSVSDSRTGDATQES